jgi:formylglycine-generating enzyme required for sulfatase activity
VNRAGLLRRLLVVVAIFLTALVLLVPGQAQTAKEAARTNSKEITNSVGMKLARIPPGKFTMGSPTEEEWRNPIDEQQHEVEITRELWLGVHEVTQAQFQKVMGYNPSFFSHNGRGKQGADYDWKPAGGKDRVKIDTCNFPVENMSWDEAVEFCQKLSVLGAEKKAGRKYCLPSEAEWEYACRGRAPSYQAFHVGDSLSSRQANFVDFRGRKEGTCRVGSYEPNSFGLFDMHGNVREWCADRYDARYYARSPQKDPAGPAEGESRVMRGGCWSDFQRHCRSARRNRYSPGVRSNRLGFRVAMVLWMR